MSARPYSQFRIERLEELAQLSKDDPELRRKLIAELRVRTKPRAKKLLEELEGFRVSGVVVAQEARFRATADLSRVDDSGGEDSRNVSGSSTSSSFCEQEPWRADYEALRETFTVEAELLAHWGMTPLLPLDLQDLVFEEWHKKLSRGPRMRGKSLETMESDRTRIRRERDALRGAMETTDVNRQLINDGNLSLLKEMP